MPTITKASVEGYVMQLIGGSSVSIDDPSFQLGMEDVVRKCSTIAPELLRDLETVETISDINTTSIKRETPITPLLRVFYAKRNDNEPVNEASRISSIMHARNPYSLFFDNEVLQYDTVANTINLSNINNIKDVAIQDAVYAVGDKKTDDSKSLYWSERLAYPLALYIAMQLLMLEIKKDINDSIAESGEIADLDANDIKILDPLTYPTLSAINVDEDGAPSLVLETPYFSGKAPYEIPTLTIGEIEDIGTLKEKYNGLTTLPAAPAALADFSETLILSIPSYTHSPIIADLGDFTPPAKPEIDIGNLSAPEYIDIDEVSTVNDLINSVTNRLAEDDVELAQAELDKVKTYLSERAQYVQEYAHNLNAYIAQFQNYKTQIETYGLDVQAWLGKLKKYETRIALMQADLQKYATQLQIEATKIQEYEAKVNAYVAKTGAYNAEVQAYIAKLQGRAHEVEALGLLSQDITHKLSYYNAQLQKYGAEMEAFNASLQAFNAKVAVYANEIQAYGAEVNKYSQDIASYGAAVQAANLKIASYSAELQGVSTELAVYTASLERANILSQFFVGRDASLAQKMQALVQLIASKMGLAADLNRRYMEFFTTGAQQ